jgi:hypothetical protein
LNLLYHEEEAQELHEKLGAFGAHSFLPSFLSAAGSELHPVMTGQVWEFNGGPWKRSAVHSAKWASFAKALEQDANAELKG